MENKCILLLCFLAITCSCSAQIEVEDKTDTLRVLVPGTVSMGLPAIEYEDDTKTSVSSDEISGLSFIWTEGDAVGVYAEEGGFSRFSLSAGAGTNTALFDGQGFKLTSGKSYSALYPYDQASTNPAEYPVSYSSFAVSGNDRISDLIPFDPLYASATADETGAANFDFKHISSFARIKCTMPARGTFTRIDLLPTYNGLVTSGKLNVGTGEWTPGTSAVSQSINLSNMSASSEGEELTLWIPLAPQNLEGNDVAAIIYDSEGKAYTSRLKGKTIRSGAAYRWNVAMPAFSKSSESGVSLSKMSSSSLSNVPSGQYSGITQISETRYAVVHDKARGGGIYYFDLNFNKTGSLSGYSYSIPEGTSSASASRDPEGVAYVPDSNTLFVSGEGDQQILEYDMTGAPTGRSLAVPADMSKSVAGGNAGFEALDYNVVTKKFWTTTESNLSKDASYTYLGGKLLRLQSFNSDLTAGERYFYVLDEPQKSSASARNYAFGVPDILALDDGRLIVIEREAYIPNGGYGEILVGTVVYLKFYEVNPSGDNGGVLSKKLVTSMTISGALSFANYEGVCFGPVLGGKRTVLMVSDSQDRYEGVLQDWLMVLSISGI